MNLGICENPPFLNFSEVCSSAIVKSCTRLRVGSHLDDASTDPDIWGGQCRRDVLSAGGLMMRNLPLGVSVAPTASVFARLGMIRKTKERRSTTTPRPGIATATILTVNPAGAALFTRATKQLFPAIDSLPRR